MLQVGKLQVGDSLFFINRYADEMPYRSAPFYGIAFLVFLELDVELYSYSPLVHAWKVRVG